MKTTPKSIKIALIIAFLSSLSIQAQISKIDSLKKVLSTSVADTNKVNTLNYLCSLLFYDENTDSVIVYGEQSLNLAKELNYKRGIGVAYNKIASYYVQKGNSPKALQNYLFALQVKQQTGDKEGIAYTYLNIGRLYDYQSSSSKAIKYYNNSLKIMSQIGNRDGEIGCYIGIGNNLKDRNVAISVYENALKIAKEIDDKSSVGLLYNNIGFAYINLGKYQDGIKNQFLALGIHESMDYKGGVAISLLNIGLGYKGLKQYDKSEDYTLQALKIGQEIGYIELIRDAKQNLSEVYSLKNEPVKSLEYYKSYIATRDSFINTENTKKTVELEMNYEFDKKQQALKLEQEKKDAIQKAKLYSVISGLVLAVILIISVFRNYKRKQKDNILLNEQKEELNEKNRIIEDKQKELLSSIRYAKRIQESLMTHESYIERSLNRLMIKS